MARPRKQRTSEPPPLLALIEAQERSAAARAEFRAGLSRDLSEIPEARELVAERLSRLLGAQITKSKLDCWTAPGKDHRMPAEYLPAFVEATGRHGALRALVRACGCVLVVPSEVRAELDQVVVQRRALEERERLLRALEEVCG